jgi:hypothetical protein
VLDIDHPQQPKELLVLLSRQHLSESIGYHPVRRDPSDRDPPSLDFLPHLVLVDIDMSELGVEYYIVALNQCNSALIIAVDSDLVG